MISQEMSAVGIGAYGSPMSLSRWHCDHRPSFHLVKCGWILSAEAKKGQVHLLNMGRESGGLPFRSWYGARWSSSDMGFGDGRMPKRMVVRARAGSRNISTVIAAVAVPFLLVAITVIVSIIVADRSAEEYVEEIIRKRAYMEKDGIKEDIILDGINEENESVLSRPRNRPKREE